VGVDAREHYVSARRSVKEKTRRTPARTLAGAAGLVVLVALAYGGTLRSEFVWDDHELLRLNAFYGSGELSALVSKRYFAATRENGYRPLVTLAHLANQALTGIHPWGFRAGNVVLHTVGVLAVFAFLVPRFGAVPSTLAAALYAVHPLHTEAVNVAALRADLLCVPLALAALAALARGGSAFAVGLLLYGLALFAKEAALVVPVLWWLAHRAAGRPVAGRQAASLVGVTAAYAAVRFVAMVNPDLPRASALAATPAAWIGAETAMLGRYAAVVAAPVELCASYGGPPGFWPWGVVGLVAIGAAVATAIRLPAARYGLAWFFVALVPVAGIVPLANPMADRYLTLPLVGLALLTATVIARRSSPPVLAVATIAITLLLGRTLARNGDWRSDERIWAATVRDCPPSARALVNLAAAVGARGDEAAAVSLLRRALALEPASATARVNLGLSLVQLGRLDEARRELETVRDADPRSAIAHTYLALVLVEQNDLAQAEAELRVALVLDPHEARARVLLARVLRRSGRVPEARALLDAAANLPAAGAEVHYERAALLAAAGELEPAIAALEQAIAEGLPGATALDTDPELAPLHGLPAFAAAVRRAGARAASE
jgi:Flp pilus assembly protein TadD